MTNNKKLTIVCKTLTNPNEVEEKYEKKIKNNLAEYLQLAFYEAFCFGERSVPFHKLDHPTIKLQWSTRSSQLCASFKSQWLYQIKLFTNNTRYGRRTNGAPSWQKLSKLWEKGNFWFSPTKQQRGWYVTEANNWLYLSNESERSAGSQLLTSTK